MITDISFYWSLLVKVILGGVCASVIFSLFNRLKR